MAAATAHAQPPPVLAVKPAALMGLAGKGASPLGGKKLGTLVVVVYRAVSGVVIWRASNRGS